MKPLAEELLRRISEMEDPAHRCAFYIAIFDMSERKKGEARKEFDLQERLVKLNAIRDGRDRVQTALSWAAEIGQLKTIEVLIEEKLVH